MITSFGYIANAKQSSATMNGINFVVNFIPAICYALALIPAYFYNISEKRYEEIRISLDTKSLACKGGNED